ncbi:MAG: Cof-type HAD-IIB family hydrolase [Gemmataceae bacterium]|nr:Cof-type HAD-IIB family hydrolase [Gemmataceae bacterium]MCI0740237.1 Cof-type HAD-IIB family hydrolase [Gemmataceae bacterium]
MRYHVLACDYDGTLAHDGHVDAPTVRALEQVRATGRILVLVTGRELAELLTVLPHIKLFARVVAENGALLYQPGTGESKLLSPGPPEKLVEALRNREVPISVGHSIVATWRPYDTVLFQTIRDLGLEWHIIFNKNSVMALPSGVNKATGLTRALEDLGILPQQTVGVGDAENDHAFLDMCGCSVAVANALPSVKERADLVMQGSHGAGVVELIEQLLADDLESFRIHIARRHAPA